MKFVRLHNRYRGILFLFRTAAALLPIDEMFKAASSKPLVYNPTIQNQIEPINNGSDDSKSQPKQHQFLECDFSLRQAVPVFICKHQRA